MAVKRGSTFKLLAIKEVTAGTTPATPAMSEIPVVNFTPSFDNSVIKSEQIRSHPYLDKMMQGRFMSTFGTEWELQGGNHDILFETMFGSAISAKAMAFADALKTLTMEEQVGGGSSLFDQYTYAHLTNLSITANAGDSTPVRCTAQGATKTATLGASATISDTIVAAADVDPFTFIGGSLTIGGGAVDIISGAMTFDRQVDALMIWGSRNPREFVPGAVTATGTITLPYDNTTQAASFTAFSDLALVFKFGLPDLSVFRQFTFQKTKLSTLGRGVTDRGIRTQEFAWEAKYNSGTTSICTLGTE